ncbi:hypothetical protein HanHA300_Chr05g0159381 [Helianthus annuus]|nr:hypothetical protein HanHA300_Chr05g0159381 [Helianthus annuus]
MLQFDYILVLKLCFVKQIHLAWGLSCYLYVRYCIYYFSRSNMDRAWICNKRIDELMCRNYDFVFSIDFIRILLESWRRCPIERCILMDVQAKKKALYRAKLKAQNQDKRIDSPLVRLTI